MKTGVVKWWNDSRGFGFITGEDGKDYFVHYTHILMSGRKGLTEGQKVNFDTDHTEKGIQAINVSIIED